MAGITSTAVSGLVMPASSSLLRTSFHGKPLVPGGGGTSFTVQTSVSHSSTILCIIGEPPVEAKDAQLKGWTRPSDISEHLEMGSLVSTQSKSNDSKGIYTVRKPPFYTVIPNLLIDALENTLVWAMYGNNKPKNYYLQGNYGPVEEFGPEPVLSVKGHIPECLNGEFVRIGPNPKQKPKAKYSWFDGDGMLHGVRVKDGKVSYVCRYVKTSRFQQEEYWGGPKFRRIGDLVGKKGLVSLAIPLLRRDTGVIDATNGHGNANTALAFHNGKLLALSEADKPYVIRVLEDGAFETVNRIDYDGKLKHPFTAHPKVDPDTGEMFTFGYQIEALPYITYRVISKDGVMGDPVTISPSGPIMMHDFAITENYAIFMDHPLYFNPKDMVRKEQDAFSFDGTKPARFGVLPRYAKNESEMRWFECSPGVIFHTANAWEEGDEVVLLACRVPGMDLTAVSEYDKAKCEAYVNVLYEYRFNMKTGKAVEKQISEHRADFPRINEHYIGRTNRFVYLAVMEDVCHNIGVVKYDLTKEPELGQAQLEVGGNVAGVFWHGSLRYGSEPFYVPKNPGREVDEDDGYLLNFVFDENTWKSEVIVIDAKTMSSEPVAVIELPSRVPYGFHGMFVSEEQLQLQSV
ncbi:unnamed protein product [Calypogeia fissa]